MFKKVIDSDGNVEVLALSESVKVTQTFKGPIASSNVQRKWTDNRGETAVVIHDNNEVFYVFRGRRWKDFE